MAFKEIVTSTADGVIIIISGLLFSGLFLYFGLPGLVNPPVPDDYLKQNTVICLGMIGIGIVPLFMVIAAVREIILRKRNVRRKQKS